MDTKPKRLGSKISLSVLVQQSDRELGDLKAKVDKFNREWAIKFESVLHQANAGPMWTKDERVAYAVAQSLHNLDGNAYRLDAYSIMSNHVHVVFKPFVSEAELCEQFDEKGHPIFISNYPGLSSIMHSLKGVVLDNAI